jgi:succinyl-diaminopimelate desuccinylase
MNVIGLVRKLISFNTVNPPGKEASMAKFIGEMLFSNGLNIKYVEFNDKCRLRLIAEKGITEGGLPMVLSEHFDTVPLGKAPWTTDPFDEMIIDDKIYGR